MQIVIKKNPLKTVSNMYSGDIAVLEESERWVMRMVDPREGQDYLLDLTTNQLTSVDPKLKTLIQFRLFDNEEPLYEPTYDWKIEFAPGNNVENDPLVPWPDLQVGEGFTVMFMGFCVKLSDETFFCITTGGTISHISDFKRDIERGIKRRVVSIEI